MNDIALKMRAMKWSTNVEANMAAKAAEEIDRLRADAEYAKEKIEMLRKWIGEIKTNYRAELLDQKEGFEKGINKIQKALDLLRKLA